LEIDNYKEALMIMEKCKIEEGFPGDIPLCCKIYYSNGNNNVDFAIFAEKEN
jgi:hypothetical protein